ncbi:MAG: ABC transporter ATP-binding protein [Myxococcales bacterium]|nr:ABC transporter ATP-binding protein [Myxococcales bacterium]
MEIACQDLSFAYGRHRALQGVSFALDSPCVGLLGPNGAGKSTLLRCLLGQLRVPAGRVRLGGLDPARDHLAIRQHLGYMPERDVYFAGRNALEMVAYCAELSGLSRVDAISRAHEVLNYVELGEARYREVRGYSSGMRQRVRMAAALVHGPDLVLLDEPTTGLDPGGREEMLRLIDDMAHRRGVRVLLSSHILPDIERVSDHLVVMAAGAVRFAGSREDFLRLEARRLQVRVKADAARFLAHLRQRGIAAQEVPESDALLLELDSEQGPVEVFRIARECGVQVRTLLPARLTLEQAFQRTVAAPGEVGHG